MPADRSAWPHELVDRPRSLIAGRQSLVTAVLATGRHYWGRCWPAGDPLLRRYQRSTRTLPWFEVDDEYVWLIEKQDAVAEAWRTQRTA